MLNGNGAKGIATQTLEIENEGPDPVNALVTQQASKALAS